MEKGIIKLTPSGKEFSVSIDFRNGKKPTTVSSWKEPNNGLEGKEVDVERMNGTVKEVYLEGKKIFPKENYQSNKNLSTSIKHTDNKYYGQSKGSGYNSSNTNSNQFDRTLKTATENNKNNDSLPAGTAKAPYNFIPLQNEIVKINELPTQDRYHKDRLTGYIQLEVETLTPIYIRDSLGNDEIEKTEKIEKKNKDNKFINSNFFSPYGKDKFSIPGSSMRGMIRSLVEIVSFGNFGYFDDKRLYYRGVADVTSLRNEYSRKMTQYIEGSKRSGYTMMAGVLKKNGYDSFEIISSGKHNEGFAQINITEAEGFLSTQGKTGEEFSFYDLGDRYLIISGMMGKKRKVHQNKKREKYEKRDWIIYKPKKDALSIQFTLRDEFENLKDIKDYQDDKNRSSINLIKQLDDYPEGIPCFYTLYKDFDGQERIAFGHTGMFRLPYQKKIGDLIPTKLSTITYKDGKYENLDYAYAIFGFVNNPISKENNPAIAKAISGRVSFTDFLSEKVEVMEELVPKILSNPKPTTFQYYLEQAGLDQNGKERNHYNSNTKIRGNKLYWHHSKDDLEFIEKEVIIYKDVYNGQIRKVSIPQKEILEFVKLYNDEDISNHNREKIQKKLVERVINKLGRNTLPKDDKDLHKEVKEHFSQYTIIKPIRNATFKGKIYFENLSEKELGCLLFSLDLPKECAHKIGMGKPLGLGSVKITPKLFISNRNNQKEKNGRYSSLKSEWNSIPESKKNIEDYKNIFAKDILKGDANITWKNLWEHPRFKELKIMLQLNNGLNKEKLRYFEISKLTEKIKNDKLDTLNEFKDRKILSPPTNYSIR